MLTNRMIRTAAVLAAFAALVGCSGTKVGDDGTGTYDPNNPGGGSSGGFDPDAGPRPPIVRDGGAQDTRNLYQTKSAAQLAASIAQCVGPGKTTIAADMIQTETPPACFSAETGACSFLTGGLYSASNDIVTSQARTFDGAESATRQGTRPDQLGVEVLTALQATAGVVSSNCLRGTDPLCACNTHQAALDMMARCLPNFDPATPEYQAAAAALETKCATLPGAAVASLLASYAFLRVN